MVVEGNVTMILSQSAGNEHNIFSSPSMFHYFADWEIYSVDPQEGSARGGTLVIISGRNFNPSEYISCRFGDSVVKGWLTSSREVECITPQGFDVVPVLITFDGREFVDTGTEFTFNPDVRVHPSKVIFASTQGGTLVEVPGTGYFQDDKWKCKFGEVLAKASIVSCNKLTCLSPAGLFNSASFHVVDPEGKPHGKGIHFQTKGPLHLISMNPSSCLIPSQSTIFVQVENLQMDGKYQCSFGHANLVSAFSNGTHVTCSCPTNMTAGMVVLTVQEKEFLDYKENAGFLFQFYENPIIEEIEEIKLESSNLVIISGDNFSNSSELSCRFDSKKVQAKWISRFQIECHCPFRGPGIFDLYISNNGVDFVSTGFKVKQIDRFSIGSIEAMEGTDHVAVRGNGFDKLSVWTCMFENVSTNATVTQGIHQVICKIPIQYYVSFVPFKLCRNGVDCSDKFMLEIGRQLDFFDAFPLHGNINGGTKIKLKVNVNLGTNSKCIFGDVEVGVFRYPDTLSGDTEYDYFCSSPPKSKPGETELIVAFHGTTRSKRTFLFKYDAEMDVSQVIPNQVPIGQETTISITGLNLPNVQDISCMIDGVLFPQSHWVSEFEIWCTIKVTLPGSKMVWVQHGHNTTISKSAAMIAVHQVATLSSHFPCCGPSGTKVVLHGTNLNRYDALACVFGTTHVHARIINGSSIECVAPPQQLSGYKVLSLTSNQMRVVVSELTFLHMKTAEVFEVVPRFIDISRGETNITLKGSNFDYLTGNDLCSIGSISSRITKVSNSTLICDMKRWNSTGSYPVFLQSDHYPPINGRQLITIVPSLELSHIYPTWTKSSQPEKFEIYGQGFIDSNFTCFFDETIISERSLVASSTYALCWGPPMPYGIHRLQVSNDGFTKSKNYISYQTFSGVSLTSYSPSHGLIGTILDIKGRRLDNGTYCLLNESHRIQTIFYNATFIQCIVPQLSKSGTVSIDLTLDGRKLTYDQQLNFTFVHFHIKSIRPSHGIISGGTRVTVTLDVGKSTDVSNCMFGDIQVEAFISEHSSLNEVICIAPRSNSSGHCQLELSSNGVDSTNQNLLFEYIKAPLILDISPMEGPSRGGTIVTVQGSDFPNLEDLKCYFGSKVVIAQWHSDELVTCQAPELAPGHHDLELLSSGNDNWHHSVNYFSYLESRLYELQPAFGISTGGTEVIVLGTNFMRDTSLDCQFGGKVVPASFLSHNELKCTSPKFGFTREVVQFHILMNGKQLSSEGANFTFYQPLFFHNLEPSFGSTRGGTTVSVQGEDLPTLLGPLFCLFDDEKVAMKKNTLSSSTCLSPPSDHKRLKVRVSILYGNDVLPLRNNVFEYNRIPSLFRIVSQLSSKGEEQVLIQGNSFQNYGGLLCCKYSDVSIVFGSFLNSTHILCPLPSNIIKTMTEVTVSNNCLEFSKHSILFKKTLQMKIISIANENRLFHEQSIVPVIGREFSIDKRITCIFNNTRWGYAAVNNSTFIQCIVPRLSKSGTVSLDLTLDGRKLTYDQQLNFTFVHFHIKSIRPSHGIISGGTRVTVTLDVGKSTDVSNCMFGDIQVEAFISEHSSLNEVICIAPRSNSSGHCQLELSSNGVDSTNQNLLFEYIKAPLILDISPMEGPSRGGTIVTVQGSDFPNLEDLKCYFGSKVVIAQWHSDELVTCQAPELAPGHHEFGMWTDIYQDKTEIFSYYANVEPTLHEITASLFNERIGRYIVLKGQGFVYQPGLECIFNNTSIPANFIDSNCIMCALPYNPGNYSVGIVVRGRFLTKTILPLQVHQMPVIKAAKNKVDEASNQNILDIHGSFKGSVSLVLCKVGSDFVSGKILDTNHLQCMISSRVEGNDVGVSVSVDGGIQWSNKATVTLSSFPILLGIKPSSGTSEGNTIVTISGSGFRHESDLRCRFGSIYSISTVWISEEIIRCKTPSHPPAIVTGNLIDIHGASQTNEFKFEFQGAPIIHSVSTSSGSSKGGTLVKINGRNFQFFSPNMLCYFGDKAVPGIVFGSTSMCCESPRYTGNTSITLSIVDHSLDFLWQNATFTYFHTPTLREVSPSRGASYGGGVITIHGTALGSTGLSWCRFSAASQHLNTKIVAADVVEDEYIKCSTPSMTDFLPFNNIFIDVATNKGDWLPKRLRYELTPMPLFLNVKPLFGSSNGGTEITVTGLNFPPEPEILCDFAGFSTMGALKLGSVIICKSPKTKQHKSVSLRIRFGKDGKKIDTGHTFDFLTPCATKNIQPSFGSNFGGTLVTITGRGFSNSSHMACRFGSISVQGYFIDENTVQCNTPLHRPGIVNVSISSSSENSNICGSSKDPLIFTYHDFFHIENVVPSNVPVGEEANISVVGEHFNSSTRFFCRINTIEVLASHHTSQRISCQLPMIYHRGPVSLIISDGSSMSLDRSHFIRYLEHASIESVTPNQVTVSSTTLLYLKGSNFFDSPGFKCHFGDNYKLKPAKWLSSGLAQCQSPFIVSGQMRSLTLSITNNDGVHVSSTNVTINVIPDIKVISFEPRYSFTTGGANIKITAKGFHVPSLKCVFGSISVVAELNGNSEDQYIACRAPHHAAGDVAFFINSGTESVAVGTFTFLPPPELYSINPSHGPTDGDTEIVIEGKNLKNVTSCLFTDMIDPSFTHSVVKSEANRSDTVISCKSPQVVGSERNVMLKLSLNGEEFANDGAVYTFTTKSRIFSVSPASSPDEGGTKVVIVGERFLDTPYLTCRFRSDLFSPGIFISTNKILCITPKSSPGKARLSISTNGVDYITPIQFDIYPTPVINGIQPTFGTIKGGSLVTLKLSNARLDGGIQCLFGRKHVPAHVKGYNVVVCYSPKVAVEHETQIFVTLNGENYHGGSDNSTSFTYVSNPYVSKIIPSEGFKDGGTIVRIYSTRLHNRAKDSVFCHFGRAEPIIPTIIESEYVECISPPALYGAYKVPLTVSYDYNIPLESGVIGPLFSYIDDFVVTGLSPHIGSIHGGSNVLVSGINFPERTDLHCVFGNISSEATFLDKYTVHCQSPSRNVSGLVTVEVASSDSISSSSSIGIFEYIYQHTVQSISPLSGSVNGGTNVIVRGNRFYSSSPDLVRCKFGDVGIVQGFILTESELKCITPPMPSPLRLGDEANISVTLNGVDYFHGVNASFTYASPLEILSVVPSSGVFTGGTPVQITLADSTFLDVFEPVCHFGGTRTMSTFFGRGEKIIRLTCFSPPTDISECNTKGCKVLFQVSINNNNDMTSLGIQFHYTPQPVVSHLKPKIGFATGGELVKVYGRDFLNDPLLSCFFGNQKSPKVKWLSSSIIHCISPATSILNETGKKAPMRVVNNGIDDLANETPYSTIFEYHGYPSVMNVTPSVIKADEPTLCTIRGVHLSGAIGCRFGAFGEEMPVIERSHNIIKCTAPPIPLMSIYSDSSAELYIDFQSHRIPMNIEIHYKKHLPAHQVYIQSLNDYPEHPVMQSVHPTSSGSMGERWITVSGYNFLNQNGLGCLFGNYFSTSTRFISSTEVLCKTPKAIPGRVMVKIVNGGSNLISKLGVPFEITNEVVLSSIHPALGPMSGGTKVTVMGTFPFSYNHQDQGVLCNFGAIQVYATDVASNAVTCFSPELRAPEIIKLTVSTDGGSSFSSSFLWYSFHDNVIITNLNPSYGSSKGGTTVLLTGNYFMEKSILTCRFGSVDIVDAVYISSRKILCISPKQTTSVATSLEVSLNGVDFTFSGKMFTYYEPIRLTKVWPNSVPATNSGMVFLEGYEFFSEIELSCYFGDIRVKAVFVDSGKLSCETPIFEVGYTSLRVVSDISDSIPIKNQELQFMFYTPPKISHIHPSSGSIYGSKAVFIMGKNFFNTTSLKCRFGSTFITKASFISDEVILCSLPRLVNEKRLPLHIAMNGADFLGGNNLAFEFMEHCQKGYYCGHSAVSWERPAPNGTVSATSTNFNFTLCEPGTFAPKAGMHQCHPCPVSFICPDFGLAKPVVCPAGSVCDRIGLVSPSSPCPPGHYCLPGTKTVSPLEWNHSKEWEMDAESGLVTSNRTNASWSFTNRESPATGKSRKERPPLQESLLAEQPFPCPIGHFCREGVMSDLPVVGNFSHPQPCYDGYFCPRGSISPMGSGPCPTGYYCPSITKAYPCPKRHYCPGVGNIEPLLCYPGTYSSKEGQTAGTVCELGHVCPEWGLEVPQLCPPGFVCDTRGLSIPEVTCPGGHHCEAGTATLDPHDSTIETRPQPCPPGVFCLGGVAHNTTLEWLPNQQEGKYAPQQCNEGYYCPEASESPMGNGPCFPGHYCPPGTAYPVANPLGTYSEEGAIVPALCFPGTYTPAKGSTQCTPCPAGYACPEYGTYAPKLCEAGTYRSKADAISCNLCPPGTFSPEKGSSDITHCLPCPPGRVCTKKGMSNLVESEPCDGGYICSVATDGSVQYDHKCPSGQYCHKGTTPESQFDFPCPEGYVCPRGVSQALKKKNPCKTRHICPLGASESEQDFTQCPRQTTAFVGSGSIRNCRIQPVDVCDKEYVNSKNPLDHNSYYSKHSYALLESNEVEKFSSSDVTGSNGELKVLSKIMPIDTKNSSPFWRNNTVEVLRSCPSFTFSSFEEKFHRSDPILLIGRNFRNSSNLTCRYRFEINGNYPSYFNYVPEIRRPAEFLATTRISCPSPPPIQDIVSDFSVYQKAKSTCEMDDDQRIYYRRSCVENSSDRCYGSLLKKENRHERHYSLFVPCTVQESEDDTCENLPSMGTMINPCFSLNLVIDASNDGKKFSGDATFIPYTKGFGSERFLNRRKSLDIPASLITFTMVRQESVIQDYSYLKTAKNLLSNVTSSVHSSHIASCRRMLAKEEGEKISETGWFEVPFMRQVHFSIDWSHIPTDMRYGEHFKLALFASPSRCMYTKCDERRIRIPDVESFPCIQPMTLPDWFLDTKVEKHQGLNLTLLALDDIILKVEIQIVHGNFFTSTNFFLNTVNATIISPNRTKMYPSNDVPEKNRNSRQLSPYLSWEDKYVTMEHIFAAIITHDDTHRISLPLNMPPRWDDFKTGRALLSMNTTHESSVPTIRDDPITKQTTNTFWEIPFVQVEEVKERVDAFLETFHGLKVSRSGDYLYDMKGLMLPYFPYFSNCREFDSYIPISHAFESHQCSLPAVDAMYPGDWWRRNFSSLPHRDHIRAVGPLDFTSFYPIADWCERQIMCEYEENLEETDVTPRWFEVDSGTSIFSILRDPVNYLEYTGRAGPTVDALDGGGSKHIDSIKLYDMFIPVKVQKLSKLEGCDRLCFPREMNFDISYYQVDTLTKRIVDIKLIYGAYDKDASNKSYRVNLKFRPLNYQELVVKFAYDRDIFLILFAMIGVFTITMAFCYWCIVRLTTQIKNPPKLRLASMLWLIFPQAISGFSLGLLPAVLVTTAVTMLIKGYTLLTPLVDPTGIDWPFFQTTLAHYKDTSLDPEMLQITRQGRMGMSFLGMAVVSIIEGSKLFIPNRKSRNELEIENMTLGDSMKESASNIVMWKRSNLILCSLTMGLFLVAIVEWSYWSLFGKYIWEAIIFIKILTNIVGNIVDGQMGEILLSAPIMTAMGLTEGIATLSANDFMDFLLSYIVGFGYLLLDRMYISPYQSDVLSWCGGMITSVAERMKVFTTALYQRYIKGHDDDKIVWSVLKPKNTDRQGGTVEPIIDSYGSYCLDTLSLLYAPYVIALLMIFRDDTEIPTRYGIKEQDMEHYATFALIIIPFQIIADAFIHGSLELFHGWKIHDYLVYSRYRFLQRESRWKGLEDSLDECIDESVRTMDHLCFSSQFYMMTTIHVNGIIYMILGIEMMARSSYNPFGDPAMPVLTIGIFLLSAAVKQMLIWIGLLLNVWRIRHENTAWHADMLKLDETRLPDWDGIRGASHDVFEMNKRISNETFRYKFLDYNRSWLIEQLPNILTPRTLRRSRPFLTNQLAQVLQKLSSDMSSDSDTGATDTQSFTELNISASAQSMMKDWIKEARRRIKQKEVVQPLIQRARGGHCEQCLSRKLLRVQFEKSYDDM